MSLERRREQDPGWGFAVTVGIVTLKDESYLRKEVQIIFFVEGASRLTGKILCLNLCFSNLLSTNSWQTRELNSVGFPEIGRGTSSIGMRSKPVASNSWNRTECCPMIVTPLHCLGIPWQEYSIFVLITENATCCAIRIYGEYAGLCPKGLTVYRDKKRRAGERY